jgi:hypothetical protein
MDYQYNNVKTVLSNYAQGIVRDYQNALKRNNKIATAKTVNSLEVTHTANKAVVGFTILGDKAFEYIEYGRRAGAKMPPKGSITQWLIARQIPLKLDYIIRKRIGERGIKPTPITATIAKQATIQIDLQLALAADVKVNFALLTKKYIL